MRTIKFRAWDKFKGSNGKMINKVTRMRWKYGNPICEVNGKLNVIIMQNTGLKDKNGKEIYEGDIVQSDIDKEDKSIIVVVFKDGSFKLKSNVNEGYCNDYNCMIREVIGNIYENPELIKENK